MRAGGVSVECSSSLLDCTAIHRITRPDPRAQAPFGFNSIGVTGAENREHCSIFILLYTICYLTLTRQCLPAKEWQARGVSSGRSSSGPGEGSAMAPVAPRRGSLERAPHPPRSVLEPDAGSRHAPRRCSDPDPHSPSSTKFISDKEPAS